MRPATSGAEVGSCTTTTSASANVQVPDFSLTPELLAFRDSVRTYAKEHLGNAAAYDREVKFPRDAVVAAAKAGLLRTTVAKEFGGRCNLRMDDTNPAAEDQEYVDAIKADVRWLGFEWDAMYYAADYFDQIYAWAEKLVEKGLAYVDDQPAGVTTRSSGAWLSRIVGSTRAPLRSEPESQSSKAVVRPFSPSAMVR